MFRVVVTDQGDAGETTETFDTHQEAVEYAKRTVKRSLERGKDLCKSADELFIQFMGFGDCPRIEGNYAERSFSARDYAQQVCKELFQE